jgi:hypothetical protein
MMRRRGIGRGVRGFVAAGLLTLCGALAGVPAQAFEPPPGSKNFISPSSVPNYFSNEAAPFGRGSQMAQPGADRFNTVPIAASRHHAAISQPTRNTAASARRGTHRSKLARGRTGRAKFVSSRTARTHVRKARSRAVLARRPAHAAPRKSVATRKFVATKHRAAASRSRHAAHGVRHASRSSR